MVKNWLDHDIESETPQKVLKNVLGLKKFREGQRELIQASLEGQDVFGTMPTGGGKSATYVIPALMREQGQSTVVVSPLIALMRDQTRKNQENDIASVDLHSNCDDYPERLASIAAGKHPLIYTSPEQLRKSDVQEAMRGRVVHAAIDEAHCISAWGHDFRAEYAQLGILRDTIGITSMGAYTATASKKVKEEIRTSLALQSPFEFHASPVRSNLSYGVSKLETKEEKWARIKELVSNKKRKGAAIVYCGSQYETEAIAKFLREEDVEGVAYYHAGLTSNDRRRIEEQFLEGDLQTVVATNALGMGIDKNDISLIVHARLPGTVEAYLQETGRCGRDGKPAACELLYSPKDRAIQDHFILEKTPDARFVLAVGKYIAAMGQKARVKPGEQFTVNKYHLYQTYMDRTKKGPPVARNTQVNAAISLLDSVGILADEGNDRMRMKQEIVDEGPSFEELKEIVNTRRKIFGMTLNQMIRYAEDPNPNQELLLQLLEEEPVLS